MADTLGGHPSVGPILRDIRESLFSDTRSSRELLEALRVGVPPPTCSDFLFGREKELATLMRGLERARESGVARFSLYGQPGAGTTHLLRWCGELAEKANFAQLDLTPEEAHEKLGAGPLAERAKLRGRPLLEHVASFLPSIAKRTAEGTRQVVREASAALDYETADKVARLWKVAPKGEAAILAAAEALIGDRSFGSVPSTTTNASQMLRLTRAFVSLAGARGLLITVDNVDTDKLADGSWLPDATSELRGVGVLVCAGGLASTQYPGFTRIHVGPLSTEARKEVALGVCRAKAAVLGTPNMLSGCKERIFELVTTGSTNTREFIREVVAYVDEPPGSAGSKLATRK